MLTSILFGIFKLDVKREKNLVSQPVHARASRTRKNGNSIVSLTCFILLFSDASPLVSTSWYFSFPLYLEGIDCVISKWVTSSLIILDGYLMLFIFAPFQKLGNDSSANLVGRCQNDNERPFFFLRRSRVFVQAKHGRALAFGRVTERKQVDIKRIARRWQQQTSSIDFWCAQRTHFLLHASPFLNNVTFLWTFFARLQFPYYSTEKEHRASS